MSGRKILTAQERAFCLLYAMHPEDPIGALIGAFDVTAIPLDNRSGSGLEL